MKYSLIFHNPFVNGMCELLLPLDSLKIFTNVLLRAFFLEIILYSQTYVNDHLSITTTNKNPISNDYLEKVHVCSELAITCVE